MTRHTWWGLIFRTRSKVLAELAGDDWLGAEQNSTILSKVGWEIVETHIFIYLMIALGNKFSFQSIMRSRVVLGRCHKSIKWYLDNLFHLTKILVGIWDLDMTKNVSKIVNLIGMGQTPFNRTSNELECPFSNIEGTWTCSSMDDRTGTPNFWLRTNEHQT